MWAVGHLALGYLAGKGVSKLVGDPINLPLLLLMSIVADMDLLIPGLTHRGPTHSLAVYVVVGILASRWWGMRTLIYVASLVSHALVGDYLLFAGVQGVQLMWPVTTFWYAGPSTSMLTDVLVEWALFLGAILLLVTSRDLQTLAAPNPINVVVAIPVVAIILPLTLGFPSDAPRGLLLPHLAYLALCTWTILTTLHALTRYPKH